MMDDDLRSLLIDKGVLAPGGIGRRASMARCAHCGRLVFRGLDGERCAGLAVVDVAPLDAFGELVARTAGLATYDLAWRGYRYEIDYRESERIASTPPGTVGGLDVVTEHRCGVNIAHRLPSTLRGKAPARADIGDMPPF